MTEVPPFSIGSATWPGAAKLAEEAAELVAVLSKLIACGGAEVSYSGLPLAQALSHELADVQAALSYFAGHNSLPSNGKQCLDKYGQIMAAHNEARVFAKGAIPEYNPREVRCLRALWSYLANDVEWVSVYPTDGPPYIMLRGDDSLRLHDLMEAVLEAVREVRASPTDENPFLHWRSVHRPRRPRQCPTHFRTPEAFADAVGARFAEDNQLYEQWWNRMQWSWGKIGCADCKREELLRRADEAVPDVDAS